MRTTWLVALLSLMGCAKQVPPPVRPAIEVQAERAAEEGPSQTLEKARLASMVLAEGDRARAEGLFRHIVVRMQDFRAEGQLRATLGAEDRKEWKGDPFEKMMGFLYLGQLLYESGDYGNALAMTKSAVLADTGTSRLPYRSDFVPAFVLQALVYDALGEAGNAERSLEHAIDALYLREGTAALSLRLDGVRLDTDDVPAEEAARVLLAARPTAVNLRWAVEHMQSLPVSTWDDAARTLHEEDIAINRAIGGHGAALLPEGSTVYTHCNAGALATGGWGTALGVVRSAWEAGRLAHVIAGETRPYLQGARLTAWECQQEDIPCTLVTDSTAASLMAAGKVDAVVVGADRVAANGDVANKIGTLGLAVLARHYGVPFYVAVPHSTLDARTPTGADIPIEERDASEVRGHGGARWAADVDVFNPAFDVTPADLVTGGWITERGLWQPPHQDPLR